MNNKYRQYEMLQITFCNKKDHILERSVSEHDAVERESSGHRVLVQKLHKGKARGLRLVSRHAHKLHVSHLLEELQELVSCGGL